MPNLTVSGNVDTMLGAADNAAIRSAIGVGQTDAPTFLAQTLTGQSLTGTQATSLVDLSATWNTTGTPTAIKLNVTDTASNAVSKLMDLQVGGASRLNIGKTGSITGADNFLIQTSGATTGLIQFTTGFGPGTGLLFGAYNGTSRAGFYYSNQSQFTFALGAAGSFGFCPNTSINAEVDVSIFRDAAGILAQRNGTAKQTLRIYNTYTSATVYERAVMDWNGPTPGNLQIGTEFLGSGSGMAARPIDFVTGGVVRMSIGAGGGVTVSGDIIASNTCRIGAGNGQVTFYAQTSGVLKMVDTSFTNFNRINLGGDTNAEPAIARDGAGIKITGAAAGSTSWIKVPAVAVSALPSAATAGVGARSFVNDALTPVFGSAVTGGGAVTVPVYSTGSAWNVG